MPPESPEPLQQAVSSLKRKKKPVRRDMEKRRQQNVQAQKKYRECLSSVPMGQCCESMGEKQRQRLETLKAIAASARQNYVNERPFSQTSPSEVAMQSDNSSSIDHGISTSVIVPNECQSTILQTNDKPSLFGIGNIHSISSPPASTPGEWQLQTSPSNTTHSHPPSPTWDSCTHVSSSFLIRDKTRQTFSPYWTTTIECGCLIPHVQLRSRDPFSHSDTHIISFGADGMATDSCTSSSIHIERVCIAAALYTLVKYMGIGEETFCADDSLSPFYRPSLEFADDATRNRTIGMIQQMYKTLKPDLRPSAEQILVKHHPYIDILPFPTLRRNLIMHQKEIDEDEFLNDTLTGLICWGGVGKVRNDTDNVTGHAAAETAWDARSWEAKVWFLRKYWCLLGREDGELVRQSEWWRSVRGEELKLDLVELKS
ncbi:hypothetical protein M431DRAFT_101334 [Trichoderma harzianum CBS 226.95]|uniref:BZIP domain-containing protein n=1 Tax=Trichoderma harzianum CBS 226.95 TaxID=983964 RepID=A0A2T3ZSS3_TRIHA|nr:hypothetical protein M431DRAFT_101334 [Trichoderma harzianum CBS 226.95]PTB47855.1 hypothetical protein M431DRAFT_101334 [Trichoderma harzianum CBS 226.95]